MSKMVCHFMIDSEVLVAAREVEEPPRVWEMKETPGYDGRYVLSHIKWNNHAKRHEAVYI